MWLLLAVLTELALTVLIFFTELTSSFSLVFLTELVVAVLPFPTTDVVLTVLTRLAKLVLTALI